MRAGAVLAAVASLGLAGCGGSSAPAAVTVTLHYSAYQPSTVTVPAGRPVTVRLRNDDPIAHEWIVGDEAVHARHRTGTEPAHAERPTEVTVPALAERTTTVTFRAPGTYTFACHLPGHEAYGMTGTLHVR